MKKIAAILLIGTVCFILGFTYGMRRQSDSPNAVEVNTNNTGNKNGQPSVQEKAPSKNEVSSSENASAEKNQPPAKSEPTQGKETTKNSTSNNAPAKKESKTDLKNSTSSTEYFVKVDISNQKAYVYKNDKLIRTMICSTGIENGNYNTPRGKYIVNETGYKKGEWFFSNKYQEGAKYWVGFIGGTYLFHSVAMDANQNIIQSEAEKLGTPASHGCIRLGLEDAYWFYKTIPSGTGLLIQD